MLGLLGAFRVDGSAQQDTVMTHYAFIWRRHCSGRFGFLAKDWAAAPGRAAAYLPCSLETLFTKAFFQHACFSCKGSTSCVVEHLRVACTTYFALSSLPKARCAKHFAQRALPKVRCAKYFAQRTLPYIRCAKHFAHSSLRKALCPKLCAHSILNNVLCSKYAARRERCATHFAQIS